MCKQTETYGIVAFLQGNVSTGLGLTFLYLATFAVLWTLGDWLQLILSVLLVPLLIWLSLHDLRTLEIPDFATLGIAFVALAHVALMDMDALLIHMATGAGVTAFIWVFGELHFWRAGEEGLGIGDAKLFGAGALLLGPLQIPELILLPSLGGIAFHIISMVSGKKYRGIPFGPFISYAIFVLSFLDPIFV